ncbi:LacI family transcriptional regulator [Opitutaceae bacterium EW11]|nr:LacI family transcriptional regulator [Opitutaceae bacterium EW11]
MESRATQPAATVNAVPRSDPPRRPTKKPTIYDLARIAEVSPGTVSRVLNNRDKVKAETRERVLRAANALNLKPQVSARFRQVAILSEPTFHDRIEGYAATLTAHLSFAFSRRNIGVVLPSNPFEQLPSLFLDGLIAVTFDKQLQALLAELETRMHVVYMDKFDVAPGEYVVRSDHFNSGYVAAQHFLARGKRRLGFLAANNNAPYVERLRGFRQALAEANVPIDERLHVFTGPNINQLSAITRIVRGGADCVYVPGTSFQAMECLHILTYVMGVKVPQEISIIGGENEGLSAIQNPPLTTIEEPLKEMADRAADMFDQLTSGARVADRHITLPVRLIERDSVA